MLNVKAKTYAMYLRTALNHGWNVLVQGPHGNGKTEIALQVAEEIFGKDSIKMFNGATMDPYVHLIGIPTPDKKKEHLVFLTQPWYKTCRVLILDDFSRASKDVRNAVMELVQFKKINGTPLPRLECVIVTQNPFDTQGTYDVERIDEALMDRFQFKMNLESGPDIDYFQKHFGEDNGAQAVSWWMNLDKKVQSTVSSRCLFNTMRAVEMNLADPEKALPIGGFLPEASNPQHLMAKLKKRDPMSQITEMARNGRWDEIRTKLTNPDSMQQSKEWLEANPQAVWDNDLLSGYQWEQISTVNSGFPNLFAFHEENKPAIRLRGLQKFARTPGLNIDNYKEPAMRHLGDTYQDGAVFYNHEAHEAGAAEPVDQLKWVVKKYGS